MPDQSSPSPLPAELKGDLEFLRRQIERGDVVLFAGAGFSADAVNRRDHAPPDSEALLSLLSSECGWQNEGDDLSDVYAQAEKHLGTDKLRSLLESEYMGCSPSGWYSLLPLICWHRIYTTNIDDVIQAAYRRAPAQQRLFEVVVPAPVRDPDPFMEEVPCVHLHGFVGDRSKPLTFHG